MVLDTVRRPLKMSAPPKVAYDRGNPESLAFLSLRELAELLRTKRVKSVELTKMYLARLKRLDAKLHLRDQPDGSARVAAGDDGGRGDRGG